MLHRIVSRLSAWLPVISAGADFDPVFYRTGYPDLAALTPRQLRRHFVEHGRPEGRHGSSAAMIAALEQTYEPLGADFDLAAYRFHNPDIGEGFSDRELLLHYVQHGREEGRTCSAFHPKFYRALYHPDWPMDVEALEADWRAPCEERRFASMPEMLDAYGFRLGRWVELIQPAEFRTLNDDWTGAVQTREQAVLAFVREGWTRLAPLSLESVFEPSFYREIHPELDDHHDAELYKAWLLKGLELDEAGSERGELRRLGLGLTLYPAAFGWSAYVQSHPDAGPGRWSALAHLVGGDFDATAVTVDDEDDYSFLLALGNAYAERGDDPSAIAAMEMARRLSPLSANANQHLADSYLRRGIWASALALYEQTVESGAFNVWTIVNGAQCAMRLGEEARAFDLLELSRPKLAGEQLWLKTLREIVQWSFDRQAYRARSAYARDEVALGDRALALAVDGVVDRLTRLAPLGAPLPHFADGRVVILANQDLRQCTHYRVEQKAELLEVAGRPHQVFDRSDVEGFLQALPGAAAAFFYRLPAFPDIIEAILKARTLGVATYYEIDDLIFDGGCYPPPLETYGGQITKAAYDGLRFGTPLYRAAMALCDYGLASTRPLAERMAATVRRGQGFVISNGLDSRNQDLLDRERVDRSDGEIRIFYGSGTLAHNSDFLELAGPALVELMRDDPRVRLVIVGYLVLGEAFEPFERQITRVGFLPDAKAYWAQLETADINLAVLEPGPISDCKSEIKWLEAAVFAIPSVVTPTAAYRDMLEDGVDVMFADGVEGWRRALGALVQDDALRRRVGQAGRAKAVQAFSLEAGVRALARALAPADAAGAARAAARVKPRLMIVNVYFPPQTIGGATRVVRDNIDSWIASGAADAFEIAVVATDHEARSPYLMRVDSYRGLPVFRISTPIQVNMDWRPFDHEVGWMFGEVLDLWKPDLVHFHAAQRLTASCLQACRSAGIPYFVTAHDAWWISDWQFLTDDDGRLQSPGRPLLATSANGVTPVQSAERLERLGNELHGAQAVLAVSETFAELYRSAGFERTVAVPNGLPHISLMERRPSRTGRVRLGHVGSMSLHKGYHLVRAALQRGGFTNLELTIVDHARADGVEHQLWGATPVRIIGKVPQASIHTLYADLDVLLAPSIWPESYGLVAREALAAGLWVIASDRGAMGEDVMPGMNGFVIDVSSTEGLLSALRQIDDAPSRYLRAPDWRPQFRTADQQAEELVDIYQQALKHDELLRA